MKVGTASKNHQRYGREADDSVDDRKTCPGLWLEVHSRWGFTIDAAASPANAMLPRFWTRKDNALKQRWVGERVWCNPPYSRLDPWVAKAWEEHAAGCELIVMLIPNNRADQPFWQEQIERRRDRSGSGLRVEFVPGRPRFTLPNGDPMGRPPFGVCLLIWERAA